MRYRTGLIGALAAGVCLCAAPQAAAEPKPGDPSQVPPRTAISVRSVIPGVLWGTANESEPLAALSISKLYLADYALRRGDGSAEDRELGERMIRFSEDDAADRMAAKYPYAIDAVAQEYGLAATSGAGGWEVSTTSTADVADFLAAKVRTEPDSPILDWMTHAGSTAADGTKQNWGTARLPQVRGTKWGWSDMPPPEVASASFGPGFTVSAHTYGTADDQTADVQGALAGVITQLIPKR
ncbi:hypothetical protein [Nocardia sp. NPDC020380]|uniref:hypothetical protein n=1 Tax=Nocardia sp. NPDC020380 TaxID=3364309 RepID=UPI0037B1ED2B